MEENDEKVLKKTIIGFSILLSIIGFWDLFLFIFIFKSKVKIPIFILYFPLTISILSFTSLFGIVKRKKFGFSLGAILGILIILDQLINLFLFGKFSFIGFLLNLILGISLIMLVFDKVVRKNIFNKNNLIISHNLLSNEEKAKQYIEENKS